MTLKNPKAKGSKNERRSRDYMERLGYSVTKAGGSLGLWDLVAVGATRIVLIQTKSNRNPGSAEMQRLKDFVCPKWCDKVVHRWDDRTSEPKIMRVA